MVNVIDVALLFVGIGYRNGSVITLHGQFVVTWTDGVLSLDHRDCSSVVNHHQLMFLFFHLCVIVLKWYLCPRSKN